MDRWSRDYAGVFFIAVVLGACLLIAYLHETKPLTPEQEAHATAMEEQIRTARCGDLIETAEGEIWVVEFSPAPDGIGISIFMNTQQAQERGIRSLARKTKRVVRKQCGESEEYCKLMSRLFYCTNNSY